MKELNFITIGKKIKYRRKSLGITQEQIAEYLDVNPSHISNIETGRAHPSLSALVHIADFLHCSIDTFIDEEYTYSAEAEENNIKNDDVFYQQFESKLKLYDAKTKEKLIKIMDIL